MYPGVAVCSTVVEGRCAAIPVGSIPHQEGDTGPAVSPRGSGPSGLSAHTWVETVARGGMSRVPSYSPDPQGEGAGYGLFQNRHGPHFHPSRLVGPVRLPPPVDALAAGLQVPWASLRWFGPAVARVALFALPSRRATRWFAAGNVP